MNDYSPSMRLWRTVVTPEAEASTDHHYFCDLGRLLDVNFLFLSFLSMEYDDSNIALIGLLRAMPDMWHTVIQVFTVVNSISIYTKKSEHRKLSLIP